MTLAQGIVGTRYIVTGIHTDDDELEGFLLSLGCYQGEVVGIVTSRGSNFTVSIRDGRYTIDKDIAETIAVSELTEGAMDG